MSPSAPSSPTFGHDVRQRRKALGLTQDELGRRAACSGHAIRKIEANERRPSSRLADRLALHLRVPPDQCEAFTAMGRGCADPGPASETMQSLAELPFVGRDDVMARLRERLARLGGGPARAILVQGDAGIGKTRLLSELAAQAARLDIATLQARACPLTQGIPFNIVDQWLHQMLPLLRPGELDSLPEISRIELSRLLPSLHTCLRVAEPRPDHEPEDMHRLRCMDALRSLFERVAQGRRLVLMVDDLPWIDVRSAEVLGYLMQHGDRAGWLLVLSSRQEDLADSQTGSRLQQALAVTQHFETILLGGLCQAEVAHLLRQLMHGEVFPALSDTDVNMLIAQAWAISKGHPSWLDSILPHGL
ncbi:MAG: hypothetical protein RL456_720 [Pseudomonadota bacterium]|jgi:transcriptional regulator with XRE-family HTH domain